MQNKEVTNSKPQELLAELRLVFSGRGRWVDSLIPPFIFLILNAVLSFELALGGALGVAVLIAGLRFARRQPLRYALGGIGGVILAVAIASLLGRSEGYFLPGIIWGVLTIIICLTSLIVRRPLVAWTSFITRRWTLDWYWHPKVRPAYSEVTMAWTLFFAVRTLLQFELFQRQNTGMLGAVQLLSGWPAIILLLIASYLYGLWRLQNLGGPSVQEFNEGAKPPWQSQKRGF